ncbi:MAG: phage late control D family protein [Deltaproteobacteria bacterium]|jgi:hypothetical protein|nr:phage late control D family protein [Deltaproteobacteria bacterium]
MEEEGIWFRFAQDGKDVVLFGDDLENCVRGLPLVPFRPDYGQESVGSE